MTLAEVWLWDKRIGAVSRDTDAVHATFQYDPAFLPSGVQVSPLKMPLSPQIYTYRE
jgi:serine/threonine-protein kinase HipA